MRERAARKAPADGLDRLLARLLALAERGDIVGFRGLFPNLRGGLDVLAAENERHAEAAVRAKAQADRLQGALDNTLELYRASLATFEKFRAAIDDVQTMRSLSELPEVLERSRDAFGLAGAVLVLEETAYGPHLPPGVRTCSRGELERALAGLPEKGARMLLTPCPGLPRPDFFLGPELAGRAALGGSCCVQPLRNKYRGDRPDGVLTLYDADPARYSPDKATDFLSHFCSLFAHIVVTVRDHDQLVADSTLDELTQTANRAYLIRHGRRILDFSDRKGFPVCLLFVDLDNFKPVNDRFGHDAGDAILAEAARRMREIVRPCDIFVRWGGDEFVLLAADTDEASARGIADRLAEAVARLPAEGAPGAPGLPPDHPLSASVGLARYRRGENLEELIRRADADMYARKRARERA